MAEPDDDNFVLWCLCADAVAQKLDYTRVWAGARAVSDARHAGAIANFAYLSARGNPAPYEELTRCVFLLGGPLREDDRHPSLPTLRASLRKQAALIFGAILDGGSGDALNPHLEPHYRLFAEMHYRERKEEMAATLREWLGRNTDPAKWDEADLVTKLAAIWGKDRNP
jgi:hypothetical protein